MKFRKQFLLTKNYYKNIFGMKFEKINEYNLFYHPSLVFTKSVNKEKKIYLLGELFSYEDPKLNNFQIISYLNQFKSINQIFTEISKFYGEFIFIYRTKNKLIIFNDACSQREIYYSNNFTSFAASIKLISYSEKLLSYNDSDALSFYSSKKFKDSPIFIGNTTDIKNIKHLEPNHFINISEKFKKRFFPLFIKQKNDLATTAKLAGEMIKGYLKAISIRHKKLVIPLTSGYDSRVLFLASLDLNCEYYVSKHLWMNDSHPDILISKKLAGLFGKKINIIADKKNENKYFEDDYVFSVDHPRGINFPEFTKNKVIINGNISEVARCYYVRLKNVSALNLIFLNKLYRNKFVLKTYKNWIVKNFKILKKLNYDIMDMFYWEEKMGIMLAKMKSEASAIGIHVKTPYNSRKLLNIMLGVDQKYRNNFETKLYDEIIKNLCNNPIVYQIPVNPSRERVFFILLKKLSILNIYLLLRMRFKQLFI